MSLPPGEPSRVDRYEQPTYEYTRPVVVEQQTYTTTSSQGGAAPSSSIPVATGVSSSASPATSGRHHHTPSGFVEVRPVARPGAIGLQSHYEHDMRPEASSRHKERRHSPAEHEYEGAYMDYDHGNRGYLMHLGSPPPSRGPAAAGGMIGTGGLFSDRRRRDYDEAMERRRLEATHMRLDEATGFSKKWYKLENESLADRTRYPIKGAGLLQLLNLLGFLGALTIAILTVVGVFRYSYQEVWDIYTTRFTPAAYVLAIWPVIYAYMALFIIYQILPYQRTNLVLFHDIGIFFIFACILQVLTDLFYGLLLVWAAAGVITGLLIVLLLIYVRIGIGWKKATPPLEYFCVHVLFCIWSGYIATLTITYWATAAFASAGWAGAPWTGQGWAILFMCLITLIALLIIFIKRDGWFALSVGWTLVAIARKNHGFPPVPLTFYITGGVLMALGILTLIFKFFIWIKECRDREVVILKPNAAHQNTVLPSSTGYYQQPTVVTTSRVEPTVVTSGPTMMTTNQGAI